MTVDAASPDEIAESSLSVSATVGPTCFVAMPIKSSGSAEHRHYEAIFETIRDSIVASGFDCLRADKDLGVGNISRRIVQRLVSAEIVIADLTDLNPNVFYELGVRHAMRRLGTILLMDKSKSESVPFDVNQYEVIFYEGDIAGIRELVRKVNDAVRKVSASGAADSDSPVHDWYPELPPNVIEFGQSNTDESLRKELLELREQIDQYRSRYPDASGESMSSTSDGLEMIRALRRAAASRELPVDLIAVARETAQQNDLSGFFGAVEDFFASPYSPISSQFVQLAGVAQALGQNAAERLIIDEACQRFPMDQALQRMRILKLSRSDIDAERNVAKAELAAQIGFDLDALEFIDLSKVEGRESELGHLVEILHTEESDELGLRLLTEVVEVAPSRKLQRNIARSLGWLGRLDEAKRAYTAVVGAPIPDQESLRWFGNFLHNNGHHVDAAEFFLLEAFFDLDDPNGFVNFGAELTFEMYEPYALKDADRAEVGGFRALPPGVGTDLAAAAIAMGFSCPYVPEDAQETAQRANQRAGGLPTTVDPRVISKDDRIVWLRETYPLFSSELSRDTPLAKRLSASE
jgi:hypothetical protein